ncbi:MAG: phosphatase PAP2 family protein [Bacteroidota bacterium]|jgi:membrane-associated phospholipid phosphatase
MTELSIKNFKTGAYITAASGSILIALSYLLGKSEFFLLLNANLGYIADKAFTYITNLGDGIIWIPIAVFVLLMRKKYTVLLLGCILYSTLFAQIPKHFFFNGTPRPTKLITDWSLIHIVPGVYLNSVDSFPSGHTTTASSIFLLFCLLIPKKWIIPVGCIYLYLVAYSRIYLAQHFPLDVGAGMIAGIISVYFSLRLQKWKDQYSKQH